MSVCYPKKGYVTQNPTTVNISNANIMLNKFLRLANSEKFFKCLSRKLDFADVDRSIAMGNAYINLMTQ